MENPNCWSELPFDLMASIFEYMSFLDFQRAKLVCSNWYLASKHRVIKTKGPPLLLLFPKEKSNCILYNPEANKFYKPFIDYSGFRFLANSGKWFLVVTPEHNLCIIDLFTSERINLPPLESLVTLGDDRFRVVGDKGFQFVPHKEVSNRRYYTYPFDTIRGLLWVDEKNKANYVVIWYLYVTEIHCPTVAFCKNGSHKYVPIPNHVLLLKVNRRSRLLLLKSYKLYIHTSHCSVAIVDLSVENFPYITRYKTSKLQPYRWGCPTRHLTVTSSGEVLVVFGILNDSYDVSPKISTFKIYKDDPDIEVESLGSEEEALLIDLGVTISVKDVHGIEPNCIYYSHHYNLKGKVDICVYNITTNTLKRFSKLSAMVNDARWFIPTIG